MVKGKEDNQAARLWALKDTRRVFGVCAPGLGLVEVFQVQQVGRSPAHASALRGLSSFLGSKRTARARVQAGTT